MAVPLGSLTGELAINPETWQWRWAKNSTDEAPVGALCCDVLSRSENIPVTPTAAGPTAPTAPTAPTTPTTSTAAVAWLLVVVESNRQMVSAMQSDADITVSCASHSLTAAGEREASVSCCKIRADMMSCVLRFALRLALFASC